MDRPKTQRHFPAHLSPIDRFLLDDDSPHRPMTYVIQMECDGAFDREKFEAALAGAIERHPYTRAKIGPGKRGIESWVDAKGERPEIDWAGLEEPIELPEGEPIDVRKHIGLRVWVRQDDQQSRVVFQWHHVVTDGTGAFRFIGDILALYDQACGGEKSQMLPLDPALLKERRARMTNAYSRGDRKAVRGAIWRQLRNVFMSWSAPLTPPSQPTTATFPGIQVHSFTKAETQAIRAFADNAGVMLNDLLIERLFQTMNDWNQQQSKRSRRPLRVMMPSDLRESTETEMPAANMVGYNFLSRPASHCSDAEALLRDIAAETAQIKHAQKGKDFIDAITGAEMMPRVVPFLVRRGWCLATAVLTNNGDPARRMNARLPRKAGKLTAGGVTIRRFSGVPPMRDKTNVVVAAMTYARELTISVRCDPTTFGDEPTGEFLTAYIARLTESTRHKSEETVPAGYS